MMVLICAQLLLPVILSFVVLLAGLSASKKSILSTMAAFSPFECGLTPKSSARIGFSLQFFVIALVFLIFDMELILIYPALDASAAGSLLITCVLLSFISLLGLSFFCEWSQTLLEWVK